MPPELVKTLVLGPFAVLVLVAALKDLAALLAGVPLAGIAAGLAVGVGVFALAAGMFALGWLGGGDAKLMAAAALWVGLRGLAPFAVYTAISGGVLAMALVALRSHWLRPIAVAGPAWARRLATPGEAAPYGVAIAVGALTAFALHPLA